MLANMRAFMGTLAGSAPGGRVVQLDGVQGSVMPATPERSVVNCVLYESAAQLERALGPLAEEYERAGIRAWTVWVPRGEDAACEALSRAGHVLDARPAAMALELEHLAPASGDSPPLAEAPSMALVGHLNDLAYGMDGDFERGLDGIPTDPFHVYVATADGTPACSLIAFDYEGDCGIYLVATVPPARGRGLATALMVRALKDARKRGCTTSSLQATARGRPVYERLGYRDLGEIQMWERRRSN
jgi:GNAT superfamily N-acetyltransferase